MAGENQVANRLKRVARKLREIRANIASLKDRLRDRLHQRKEKKKRRAALWNKIEDLRKENEKSPSPAIEQRIEELRDMRDHLGAVRKRLGKRANELIDRITTREDRKQHRIRVKEHLEKKLAYLKAHDQPTNTGSCFATFDGKTVPAWMVPWLTKSRANGWGGHVVSGYRTPEYSEQLCYGICGAPKCPGRCAGRTTNHACPPTNKCCYPEGAVDVDDYTNFEAIQLRIGSPLRNNLPTDPVHFSASGY